MTYFVITITRKEKVEIHSVVTNFDKEKVGNSFSK